MTLSRNVIHNVYLFIYFWQFIQELINVLKPNIQTLMEKCNLVRMISCFPPLSITNTASRVLTIVNIECSISECESPLLEEPPKWKRWSLIRLKNKLITNWNIGIMEILLQVKMWIQLLIPRIEDGNNFGVSIQVSKCQYVIDLVVVVGFLNSLIIWLKYK